MTGENNNWKRHPDLYISDGTIILVADSTLFRVYAGLLAMHSTVFQGLMESSQHLPDDAEMYDGCPLVRLPDDPEDLAYFLKAMLALCHFERRKPTSFSMASAILRLSSKYMAQDLRSQAIEHFRRIIPQSFSENGIKESCAQVFGSDEPHLFQLLSLFRECRLESFLPWTYYVTCALGFEKLIKGDITKDGQEIRLTEHDSRIALLGWKSLCHLTNETRRDVITSSSMNCTKNTCYNFNMRVAWIRRATTTFQTRAMDQWQMFSTLSYPYGQPLPQHLNEENKFILSYNRPCPSCSAEWLKQEVIGRAAIWPQLPSIFNLPDWETLKKQEEP